jgi:hypothetical protein
MVTRPWIAGRQVNAAAEGRSLKLTLSPVAADAQGAIAKTPVAIAMATVNIAFFIQLSFFVFLVFDCTANNLLGVFQKIVSTK